MPNIWWLLVIIRVLWTLYGQTGYIHPDEFFQSVEVVAGDIFHFDVYRPWEFNNSHISQPIRSIVLPYATSGFAFYAVKFLSKLSETQQLINANYLLITSRLLMVVLSIVGDLTIHRLCSLLNKDCHGHCVVMYATSYITMVYFTRTLSNTIEAFLFTILLYGVISSMFKTTDKENETHVPCACTENSNLICFTVIAGLFNRPTFAAFCLIPCAAWLLHADRYPKTSYRFSKHTYHKACACIIPASMCAILFITCDSVYYGFLKIPQYDEFISLLSELITDFPNKLILDFHWLRARNLTITPYNFIRYNTNGSNLAEHGLHPRFTHMVVNMPLLFGPMIITAAYKLIKAILGRSKSQDKNMQETTATEKDLFSVDSLLVLSVIIPLLALSIFPHQEARFLIPLLTPLLFLVSRKLHSQIFTVVWVVFNLSGMLFYGSLHQGGLIPCLGYLHQNLPTPSFLVFHKTYMPPRFLLGTPRFSAGNVHTVIDLAGVSIDLAHEEIEKTILNQNLGSQEKDCISVEDCCRIYLISPISISRYSVSHNFKYKFTLVQEFRPHLSMEDPPSILISQNSFQTFVRELHEALKLNLYCISSLS